MRTRGWLWIGIVCLGITGCADPRDPRQAPGAAAAGAMGTPPSPASPGHEGSWAPASPGVAWGDLDADGDLDRLECDAAGEPLRVLLNDGRGGYEACDPRGAGLWAPDLDGDGVPDLVLGGSLEAGGAQGLRVFAQR